MPYTGVEFDYQKELKAVKRRNRKLILLLVGYVVVIGWFIWHLDTLLK